MSILRDDIDKFFDYSLYVPGRTLYLGGEVDEVSAEYFIKGMALLGRIPGPVTVIMNSPGGDEYHGLGIFDAIATSKSYVTITAYGHAMSMGSWILQAADERIVAPSCTVMLHYGKYFPPDNMTQAEVTRAAAEFERLNGAMERAYFARMKEKNPNVTIGALRKLLNTEAHLTAVQAVELGLADRILE